MEIKNYTGTSRPSGEYDKAKLETIQHNLRYFNANKRKGILTVEHYVDGGDYWKILNDGNVMLFDMTLDQVYYTIAGIIIYAKG